jgi:hypothetical protein
MKEDAPTYVSLDPTNKVGASKVIKATPYTHPGFCIPTSEDKGKCRLPPNRPGIIAGTLPRDIRYDIGVAVFEEPVRMATYGALPKADLVDTLKEGHHLTTVGYGARGFDLAVSRPPAQPQPRPLDKRYRATVKLLNTKDPDIIGEMFVKTTGLSLVRGNGEAPCEGDSGGAVRWRPAHHSGRYLESHSPPVQGPDYYQRVDLPRVLKWIRSFP